MTATIVLCGENSVLDADLVGCGKQIAASSDIYRCVDCTVPFHRECIRKHFDKGDIFTQEMYDEQMRRRAE